MTVYTIGLPYSGPLPRVRDRVTAVHLADNAPITVPLPVASATTWPLRYPNRAERRRRAALARRRR